MIPANGVRRMAIQTDIHLLKHRRTKIVATVGPSSSESEILEHLCHAGVNVFRMNMSHGTHAGHRETYGRIRAAAEKAGTVIGVLADLCGPKIRVGRFPEGRIVLEDGARVIVTTRDVPGAAGLIPSQYEALAADVVEGSRILLDDGKLELRVEAIDGTEIACRVMTGGVLKNHKGMNLPGVKVSAPSLTDKDREDAQFALELGVDFLALSFVREPSDVEELRGLISDRGGSAAIISKIEKPEALEQIVQIIEASDGVMVARGDLGVELPPQAVPLVQDQLIDLAREHRKPVIVATQMLESMIDNPRPTRAEVSDVANAVRAGADAVMLSAETAAGRFPIKAVEMMDTVARQTEAYQWRQGAFGSFKRFDDHPRPIPVDDALAESTAMLSRDLRVRSIVVISSRVHSATVMSSSRPAAPIVAIFPDSRAGRAASLLWGVVPVTADRQEEDSARALARRTAVELGLASSGQTILLVRGFHGDPKINAPSVTVVTV